MKIIDFAYAVDTALMQGVKKFFNMQQVFLFLYYGFAGIHSTYLECRTSKL